MFAPLVLFAALTWPQAPPEAKPAGCQIQDSTVEGQSRVWLVYGVFVLPDGKEQRYLFAHRESNERKKALLDCDDFMKHYEKMAKREDKK